MIYIEYIKKEDWIAVYTPKGWGNFDPKVSKYGSALLVLGIIWKKRSLCPLDVAVKLSVTSS